MRKLVRSAVERSFDSFDQFSAFLSERPESCDTASVQVAVNDLRDAGLAFTQRFGWVEVRVTGPNYREDVHVLGVPGREMALFDMMDQFAGGDPNAVILWVGEERRLLRKMLSLYPNAIWTAPRRDEPRAAAAAPLLAVDLCDLGFIHHSFSGVVLSETLHLQPDLFGCLTEIHRVLVPEGLLLATFPFACTNRSNDASEGKRTALGWDILELCRRAGFAQSSMTYISDIRRGIVGGDLDGIFVLQARVAG